MVRPCVLPTWRKVGEYGYRVNALCIERLHFCDDSDEFFYAADEAVFHALVFSGPVSVRYRTDTVHILEYGDGHVHGRVDRVQPEQL
jgi:hypothetical protein